MTRPCFVLLILALGFPTPARSDYIVYEFAGTFEQGLFSGPVVPLGSAFHGIFAFDEFGMGVDEPFNGGVTTVYSPVYVELTVGDDTIATNAATVSIRNAVTLFDDELNLMAGSEVGAPFQGTLAGHDIRVMQLLLSGWIDTFATSEYPKALAIEDFQGGNIHVTTGPLQETLTSISIRSDFTGRSEFTVSEGTLCSTPTCQIPEPDTSVLIGTALCVAGFVMARRTFCRWRFEPMFLR